MDTPARGFASIAVIVIVVLVLAALGAEWYGARQIPPHLNQAVGETVATSGPAY